MPVRYFSRIIILLLLLVPSSLFAQFSGGDGSEANPWQVATTSDLNSVRNNLNDYFILTADIDLDIAPYNSGEGWDPISDNNTVFSGRFDGNGHTINGLFINKSGENYIGLFGYVFKGSIENLKLTNVDITGNNNVGALAGIIHASTSGNTTIENSSIEGSISGNDIYVGGLVGRQHSAGGATNNINESYSMGSVSGNGDQVGGLVGYQSSEGNSSSSITNSYSNSIVNGNDDLSGSFGFAGGLVGYQFSTGSGGFSSITTSYATGNVSGANYIGGLVGRQRIENSATVEISESYATGNITGLNNNTGGLVGLNNSGSITKSYSLGDVSGSGHNTGGFIGQNYGDVSESYSTGKVEGNTNVGGFIGGLSSGTISSNYWNTQTSGLLSGIGNVSGSGVTGLTTLEMLQQASYIGWNFSNTWTQGQNGGVSFPYLQLNIPENLYEVYSFAGGSGTTEDPLEIENATQLDLVRKLLEANFVLISDIDLDVAPYNTGEGWEPIGTFKTTYSVSKDLGFSGTFDGNGHIISGLFINRSKSDIGLFGYLVGTIKNLGLTNVNITGQSTVGGLVGRLASTAAVSINSNITNSYVTGTVTGNSNVGGLVGLQYTSGEGISTIQYCYTDIQVTGNGTGVGSGTGTGIGGVLGYQLNGGTGSNAIVGSYSLGTVSGNERVGGLVGQQLSPNNGNSITDSYSTAMVSASNAVGGLVGWVDGSSIIKSYSSGKVEGSSNVGGLLGSFSGSGSTTSSYWNIETSEQANSARGSGLNSLNMQKKDSFSEWDFFGIWDIEEGDSYPWLRDNAQFPRPNPCGNTFDGGCGTEEDPWQIATPVHLDSVRHYLSDYFILTNDIDLDTAPYNSGEGWNPIGDNSSGSNSTRFTGNFNGDGFTVSNLFIDRDETSDIGLFGYLENATVTKLGVSEVNIGGENYVGSLAGRNSSSEISLVYVTGTVEGNQFVGGLIGMNLNGADISTSYSVASVTGLINVGGFSGLIGTGSNSISESYSAGAVSGISKSGGFLGEFNSGTIEDSYWDMDLTSQSNGISNTSSGGLVGLSRVEMTKSSSYVEWDFSTNGIWDINEGISYPWLKATVQSPSPKPNIDPEPTISLSTDNLAFEEVQINTDSELTLQISNLGTNVLNITSLNITGSSFSTDVNTPISILIDSPFELPIKFLTDSVGNFTGTLTINSNDASMSSVEVELTGEGVLGPPIRLLDVSPDTLDFGLVTENVISKKAIRLTNNGNATLSVTGLVSDNNNFFVEDGPSISSPLFISAESSASVDISFSPSSGGGQDFSGILSISSDRTEGETVETIPLKGSGASLPAPIIEFSLDTLDFGQVRLEETSSLSVDITNSGNADLLVSNISSNNLVFKLSSSSENSFTLSPTQMQSIDIEFVPTIAVDYISQVIVSSNLDDESIVLLGSGVTLTTGVDSTEIRTNELIASSGQSVPITISPTGLGDNGRVYVYFKSGGGGAASEYTKEEMLRGTSGEYSFSLPASIASSDGISYWFEVTDGTDIITSPETNPNTNPYTISIEVPEGIVRSSPQPAGKEQNLYRLISVPLVDQEGSVSTVLSNFGEALSDKWRLFRWQFGEYVEHNQSGFETFAPGRGYWFITSTGASIQSGSGRSARTDEKFSVFLQPGWNMIGSPFTYNTDWSKATVPTSVRNLWSYDGSGFVNSTTLTPWEGYFVNNESNNPVELLLSPFKSGSNKMVVKELPFDTNMGWGVQLSASTNFLSDTHNFLGSALEASNGKDTFDLRDAPKQPGEYLQLSIINEDISEGSYSVDIREPNFEGHFWDFEVSSNTSEEKIDIELALKGALPENFSIRVLDLNQKTVWDFDSILKQDYLKTVRSGAGAEQKRKFRAIIGTESYIENNDLGIKDLPDTFVLKNNYPNPFNPSTTIVFGLPEASNVTLEIYNTIGRKVATLIDGKMEAGYYDFIWDASQVASGMYFYRITAMGNTSKSTFSNIQRMTLIK